jgi:hypothetical protein
MSSLKIASSFPVEAGAFTSGVGRRAAAHLRLSGDAHAASARRARAEADIEFPIWCRAVMMRREASNAPKLDRTGAPDSQA